jgi:hypothetical protein
MFLNQFKEPSLFKLQKKRFQRLGSKKEGVFFEVVHATKKLVSSLSLAATYKPHVYTRVILFVF